ncbi:MAG: DUF2914 domain-containing protein [candidate division Zixibacteria bacterium]|nr:DUF2914 domain-containing protein [candidate division Zixibacteria bacterium]
MRNIFLIVIAFAILSSVVYAQAEDSTRMPVTIKQSTITTVNDSAIESDLTVEAEVCTSIEERMPVGAGDSFSADIGELFLWSKIKGASDSTAVKHYWFYKDKEMTVVELQVKSTSWRTWSCKQILPEWTGDWETRIVDINGVVLESVSFKIYKAVEPGQ